MAQPGKIHFKAATQFIYDSSGNPRLYRITNTGARVMIVHVDGKEQGSVIVGMSRDFFGSQIIVAPDDDVSSVDGSYEFLA